jgi:hypothetical protein
MEIGFPSNIFLPASKTGTYTAKLWDYIYASGASWTLTLPSAVGNAGSQIAIQHSGTSFTQLYTINTTGGQTVGGLASGAFVLWTVGELLVVTSNGANWLITGRKTGIGPTAFTPTIDAVTTPPTPHGSAVFTCTYDRDGRDLIYRFNFSQTSGNAAGSGVYLLPPPNAAVLFDSTVIAVDTGAIGALANVLGPARTSSTQSAGATTAVNGHVVAHSTSRLKIVMNSVASNDLQCWGSGFQQLSAAAFASFIARVPVTGFQP